MMRYFFAGTILASLSVQKAAAQYYHKDIVSIKQANTESLVLRAQKVRNVLIHSFEADGTASEGFYCEKKISKDYRTVETFTKSPGTTKSLVTASYNQKGLLEQSSDSSEITASTTIYSYDDKDNITSITSYNHSSDDDFSTSLKEVHQYIYNEKGAPVKMLKIKNDRDSVQVDFLLDEKGNVAEEIEPGINGRHYYYYYDADNRLTDIVKYSFVKKNMRPDFVFEYNSLGQLTQMVSVEEGVPGSYYNEKDAANFFTWRYFYSDEGLRIIEKCYSKTNRLLGYFEYEYN